MKTIDKNKKITIHELNKIAENTFGTFIKTVVDVEKAIMMIDAELHADEEAELLQSGSKQTNLWGINLYPELFNSKDFIEFDSMINVRPTQGNRSRGVENEQLRVKIIKIVRELVSR